MSVYKRSYRPYSGPLTGERSRFFVLVRYALSDVWGSRITNLLFILCLVPTLITTLLIYIMNTEAVRLLISGPNAPAIAQLNVEFFFGVIQSQFWPALALTAWIGPKLMASDMSNSALPIILSHPVSRVEYVLAKLTVLAGLLSAVTWIPALFIFFFQARMSATPWAMAHKQIALGLLLGGVLWVAFLSLFSLAVASWVKWRIVATGMVVAGMFVPAGVGEAFNGIMRTNWGSLINIPMMMITLWRNLIGYHPRVFLPQMDLPVSAMLTSLVLICCGCVAVLNARIRAREVVRG